MNTKDGKLIYEQYQELINEDVKDILTKISYYIAIGIIPLGFYVKYLTTHGYGSKVPVVTNKVSEWKKQISHSTDSTMPDLNDMTPDPNSPLPGFGDAGARDDSSFSFQPSIVEGRTIHLMLVFTNVGIRNSRLAPNVDRKTATDQYEFLKRLIYEKLGQPPLRGTEEEWNAYISSVYAFDYTKWIA